MALKSMTVAVAAGTSTVRTDVALPIGPGVQGMQLGIGYSPLHAAMPRIYGGIGGGG